MTGGGQALAVSISGGLLALDGGEPAPALSELLSRADAALYAAKAQGRNRIVAVGDAAGDQALIATAFTASET